MHPNQEKSSCGYHNEATENCGVQFSQNDKFHQAVAEYNTDLCCKETKAACQAIIGEQAEQYRTPEGLRYLLSTVEMTTLAITDSDESVLRMVEDTNALFERHPDWKPYATICVYPNFVRLVSESLEVEGIKVACVTGAFPSSQTFLEIKTIETALAVNSGADEVDMVLSVGRFNSGDYETVFDEIAEIKAAAAGRPVKVILESGIHSCVSSVKKAALLSMYAGADFIKTSTGMLPQVATPEAAYAMAQAIKEYYDKTGIRVGLKISGGVRTVEDALAYYAIARHFLSQEWFDQGLFRIGTSRLAQPLIAAIEAMEA